MKINIKLDGYKTYIIGVASVCWAIGGAVAGKVDINLAIAEVLIALQMIALRHKASKVQSIAAQ